ncbi:MAG: RNA pseudouridine synthase [Firmicutes bacterium HGW-Firmicutes-3]|jgi:23S rRNA pseudouridine1911/1915/1917 synthase|nr:MAG: RNA pseudouridine synthase [Firmicutes bacterium HGW-Firmicutes-3]
MNNHEFIVTKEEIGERLDKYLTSKLTDVTRSHIQKWIVEEQVIVNHLPVKSNYKVHMGDKVALTIPVVKDVAITPTPMLLDIIYEDQDLLIINKPVDMVVHPAPGHYEDTLVNGIMYHCKDSLSGINGELRPGIVHRIDKDTTGLLVVCKNDRSHVHVAEQLKEHKVNRLYEAIVYNNVKDEEGTVEGPIGRHHINRKKMAINFKNGKEAITHYKVLNRLEHGFTHIELKLETGRTHQIRVHMASINHPLLGDALYGPRNGHMKLPGQMLHARTLGFIHPSTGQYMSFTAPRPIDFENALMRLGYKK